MRPNGKSGNNVVRAMSFMMLSSVTGGGDDDAAVVVDADADAGSNTAGSAWLAGFFFDTVFFSSMVMYGGWLVLESPVQSGLLAQNKKTKTKTSPHIF